MAQISLGTPRRRRRRRKRKIHLVRTITEVYGGTRTHVA
jgi:hypothetical protein